MNNLLAVMEAVTYATDAGENQQLSDGNATILDMHIEESEYNTWMASVKQRQYSVNYWANKVAADPTNKGYQASLTAAQANFQNAETEEQTYTQQADSGTQAMQNQVGQDSSNIQRQTGLEAAINQIMQASSQQKI